MEVLGCRLTWVTVETNARRVVWYSMLHNQAPHRKSLAKAESYAAPEHKLNMNALKQAGGYLLINILKKNYENQSINSQST